MEGYYQEVVNIISVGHLHITHPAIHLPSLPSLHTHTECMSLKILNGIHNQFSCQEILTENWLKHVHNGKSLFHHLYYVCHSADTF